MSALDLIKKAKTQVTKFEKHPAKDMEIEKKLHYLNGLALVMNEDDDISDKEKDYISILINSFELSNEHIDSVIEFAKNPDANAVIDMLGSFEGTDIKNTFLLDCIILAGRDGEIDNKEKTIISEYKEALSISNEEIENYYVLYDLILKNDISGINELLLQKKTLKVELFQYILDYNNLDISDDILRFDSLFHKMEKLNNWDKKITVRTQDELDRVLLSESLFSVNLDIYLDSKSFIIDAETNLEGRTFIGNGIKKTTVYLKGISVEIEDAEEERNLFYYSISRGGFKKCTISTKHNPLLFILSYRNPLLMNIKNDKVKVKFIDHDKLEMLEDLKELKKLKGFGPVLIMKMEVDEEIANYQELLEKELKSLIDDLIETK